jgi:hypothetical protein
MAVILRNFMSLNFQLLTKQEVAAIVRRTPRSLDNWWHDGGGPTRTRVGGRILVREDHLRAWLESCVEVPTAPLDPANGI